MESQQQDAVWWGLALIARSFGMAINITALRSAFASDAAHPQQIQFVRAVRSCGLKCRYVARLNIRPAMPLPALVMLPDEGVVVLLAVKPGVWLIQRQGSPAVEQYTPEADIHYAGYLFARRVCWQQLDQQFNLSWFASAFLHYRRLIGEVLLASFVIQLLALVSPLFFQVVVDKVLAHQSISTLNVLATGMLCVTVFDVVLDGLRSYQLAHTSQRIDATLSSLLYRHLLRLPLSWFLQRQSGVIVARVHELKTVREFLTGSALTLCLDLLFTVVFFCVMALYSLPLTAIVVISMIPYILLSVFITPVLRRRLDAQFRHGAKNQAFLVESLTGIESIKALAVEDVMTRRWDEQIAGFVSSSFRTQNLGNIASQISRFVNKITSIAILWYGASLVMEAELTVGALIAFNMFAGQATAPLLRLVQLWQDFQQVLVSVRRLGDILNVPTEHRPQALTLEKVKGAIRLVNVSFRWQPDAPVVLESLSLAVRPGEIIGVAGRSGSGKSTLAKLLQRLCVPVTGQLFVDGIDIAQTDPQWLRKQMGVVLQETQLFSGTIRDNIALAIPDAPLEEVIAAAELAGAHAFISDFPLGYETPVGEHGSSLSGGQKQRIGIARALLGKPSILIFDEATSALDYESEHLIQQNMTRICQGRTVFIIAHRLSALRAAHRIIVLDKGKIVEQGNHRQLIDKKGFYARLNALQEMAR